MSKLEQLPEKVVEQLQNAIDSGSIHDLADAYGSLAPEVIQQAVEVMKNIGNRHFTAGEFKEAISQYSQALVSAPYDIKLYSNRAACYLKLKQFNEAIADAEKCISLKPSWAKGWYRKGCALIGLQRPHQALSFLHKAMDLEPNDRDIKLQYKQAEQMAAMIDQMIQQQSVSPQQPGPPPEPLRSAIDETDKILQQRPTFRYDEAEVAYHPDARWYKESQIAQGVNKFIQSHSSLNSPRILLQTLEEYLPYIRLLGHVAKENISKFPQAKVAVLGCSAGILPLLAESSGSGKTYSVDQYAYEFNITKAVIQNNKFKQMQLIYGPKIKNFTAEQRQYELAQFCHNFTLLCKDMTKLDYADINEHCHVLIANLPHYTLLGTGWIPIVQNAKKHFLVEDPLILPFKARVYAVGIELTTRTKFDFTKFTDQYSWSLYPVPIDLRTESHRVLTTPFLVFEFNFKEVTSLRAITNQLVHCKVHTSGTLHGFVYYYELFLTESVTYSNSHWSQPSGPPQALHFVDSLRVQENSQLPLHVSHNKTRITFHVVPSTTLEVPPPAIPRIHYLPTWYREMVNDSHRTQAYQLAIQKACQKVAQTLEQKEIVVMNFCGGPGLLSMIAAKQPTVRQVYCVEKLPHLAAMTQEIISANHFSEKIKVIAKEPRKVTFGWEEYGKSSGEKSAVYDLHERPDVVILELFDSGSCVGEGALHYSKFVRFAISTPRKQPTILPSGARIYACVAELRSTRVDEVDVGAPLNVYRWSPELVPVDLRQLKQPWRMLSEPLLVFEFEFLTADPETLTRKLDFAITDSGIASAVVVWFDLLMDSERSIILTTNPLAPTTSASASASASTTTATTTLTSTQIKQGVFYLPEIKVQAGCTCPALGVIRGGVDLAFAWREDELPRTSGVTLLPLPRTDPKWMEHQKKAEEVGKGLMHRMEIASEFAAIATSAVRMAIQPANFAVEPETAARFAHNLFTLK